MPNQETELLIDDPRLAEHFISGELVADPHQIEVDPLDLATKGIRLAVERFVSVKNLAVVGLGATALTAGIVTGYRRTTHS